MSRPMEVLLVTEHTGFWVAVYRAALTILLLSLLGGWTLMLLLPLAHEVLHMPYLHPAYWPCVALVAVSRCTVASVIGSTKPTRKVAR